MNLPVGVLVGALNFIGSEIIERMVPYLKCENMQKHRMAYIVFIFIFTATNATLIAVASGGLGYRSGIV